MADGKAQTAEHGAPGALFLIHVLTALGAPVALLALLAGARGDWGELFIWLGVALLIDGIDGPLARRFQIATRMPRWSGAALDFVIDYATYVFLPAFVLAGSDMLSTPWNWICGGLVVFTGALYFADNGMKMPDGSFKGFPVGWNMVIFGLMALSPSETFTIIFVIAFCALTFAPIRFVHPVRVARWRVLTLSVTFVWFVAAGAAIAQAMMPDPLAAWALGLSSIYLLTVCAVQQILDRYS
ncbi:phosphatidylcholine synthase [Stappia sp. GBMRC 2046]|uniref:Phosphatidylcholine synthase n=1 Tax=Stappia sediminis TaxID=2692190 RepID=A0A7X3LT43_9HYPH|nr:CDP-alcohol phosphatidyltransferase family protein [Stappia sediminis]MXN64614.1 phosphatidylcholine synthase [Stappia sediminis]